MTIVIPTWAAAILSFVTTYPRDHGWHSPSMEEIAASIPPEQYQRWPVLELMPVILAIVAIGFFILGTLFGIGCVARCIWRYFHAVEVPTTQWYCRYWPLQRIAQVHSVLINVHRWAGTVQVECHAQFGKEKVRWLTTASESVYVEFPQQKVDFVSDPNEGDPASIVIKVKPRWWRGRSSERIQQVSIGITDHRPVHDTPDSR